jgi:sugar phosphate isomerase/epimerase
MKTIIGDKMNIPDTKIGLTLYNVRDYCKTENDLDETLKKLTQIGYEAIQVSGVNLAPELIKEKADKYGLYICASHEGLDALRTDFDSIVKKLKVWGCDFTALGSPGTHFTLNPHDTGTLIVELNEWGKRFAAEGIRFAYHNHHFEFAKAGDSLFIERLYNETDKATFFAEIDVHWVQRGGQSPVDWIRKVKGRMPVCHFKDFTVIEKEPRFCEIGEGNLDWESIIKACDETGVRWYIVEQDDPMDDYDIFKSLEISYRNMKAMGIS